MTELLADTRVLIWAVAEPRKLIPVAGAALADLDPVAVTGLTASGP